MLKRLQYWQDPCFGCKGSAVPWAHSLAIWRSVSWFCMQTLRARLDLYIPTQSPSANLEGDLEPDVLPAHVQRRGRLGCMQPQ